MKTNPLKQGSIIVHGEGIGTVTPDMVWKRAAELRMIYGHTSAVVSKEECKQARHELTGDPEMDDMEAAIESAPESARWDLIHGSSGGPTWEAPSEDVDDDGHSDSARLVEEGVREAEHDQMLLATKLLND